MLKLQLQVPQIQGRMQGAQPRVLSLWEAQTFFKMCRQNLDNQYSDKTEVKHIDMEEQSPDYVQSEYRTPYYLTNDQVKASVKCFKTTVKVHHMHKRDTEHIRPLWVAHSQGSQVSQTDCEVDTGAGCNILPTYRAQQLFGQE